MSKEQALGHEEWRQNRALLRPIMNGDSIGLYDIGDYPPTLMKGPDLLPEPLNRTYRPGSNETGRQQGGTCLSHG